MISISAAVCANGYSAQNLPLYEKQNAGYVRTNGNEPVTFCRGKIFGGTVESSGKTNPIARLIDIYNNVPPTVTKPASDISILSEDIGSIYMQYIVVKNAIYNWSNIDLTA